MGNIIILVIAHIIFGHVKSSFYNINIIPNYLSTNISCENNKLCFRKLDDHQKMNIHIEDIVNENVQNENRIILQNLIKSYAKRKEVNYYVPSVNKKTICYQQIESWRSAVENTEEWALEMIDSWGKISDGALYGMIDVPGLYDQCIYTTSHKYQISGKYCTIYYVNGKYKQTSSYREIQSRLGVLSGHKQNDFSPDYNTYGTCVPDGCNENDMKDGLSEALSHSNKHIIRASCSNNDGFIANLSIGGYLFLIYIGIMIVIMLIAQLSNSISRNLNKGTKFIFWEFCPLSNLKQIFTLDNSNNEQSIRCLHGLRVISMICIHICHELGMTVHSSNISSSYVMKKPTFSLAFFVTSASLGVDTFFFISGLLISYNAFKHFHKATEVKPISLYINRLLRLTPPIIIATWFFGTIGGRLISGPWASEYHLIENGCQRYWWKDVFYLFNFFPMANNNESFPTCIGQSWYTAIDFQLFLLAPYFIIIILRNSQFALPIIISATTLFFVIPTTVIYIFDYVPTNMIKLESYKNVEYYMNIYVMPWNRAAPWFVGFGTGYMLFNRCILPEKLSKTTIVMCWFTSISLAFGVFYVMMQLNIDSSSYENMNKMASAIYGGTHRGIWAISLAWIVYACHNGYAGLASWLEYPGFQPISRLSYSIFLLSLNIQFAISWNTKKLVYINIFSKVIESIGSFIICIIGAVLLSLLTESPTLNLLKKYKKIGSGRKKNC